MANIGVVGWYGHGNCGDESYRLSFPRVFQQHQFGFSEKSVAGCDAHILGGGDVVCDAFIKAVGNCRPKHIISATISTPHPQISEFDVVAVRDEQSVSNAAKVGVKAILLPDFAFALDFNVDKGRRVIEKYFLANGHDLYSKVVVVVINSHLVPSHDGLLRDFNAFQHMSCELGKAMDRTPASFLFVPFSTHMPWDDRTAGAWVASRCKFWKKNTVVFDALSVQDTIDVIAAADAVISTRLHSSIFSCVTATPFIDLTHNHKNTGFLKANGLFEHSIKYEAVEESVILTMLEKSFERGDVTEKLRQVADKNKTALRDFAQNVHLI